MPLSRLMPGGGIIEDRSAKLIVDSAAEALTWLEERASGGAGVAIDTMLLRTFGDRRCDMWLRKTYAHLGGEVQAHGSLRGAVLVNGVLVAGELSQRHRLKLAECHPKALRKALK